MALKPPIFLLPGDLVAVSKADLRVALDNACVAMDETDAAATETFYRLAEACDWCDS
jgi:hypothetical protein